MHTHTYTAIFVNRDSIQIDLIYTKVYKTNLTSLCMGPYVCYYGGECLVILSLQSQIECIYSIEAMQYRNL